MHQHSIIAEDQNSDIPIHVYISAQLFWLQCLGNNRPYYFPEFPFLREATMTKDSYLHCVLLISNEVNTGLDFCMRSFSEDLFLELVNI